MKWRNVRYWHKADIPLEVLITAAGILTFRRAMRKS